MIEAAFLKLKDFFLHSKSFDDVTRRVGAFLLLLPCLVGIPLGLHRPFLNLGWRDWWILPSVWSVACCGTLLHVVYGGKGWAMLTAPYTMALAHELWLIATVELPRPQGGNVK